MFKVIQKKSSRVKSYYAPEKRWTHQRELFLLCMFLSGLVFGTVTVRTSDSIILERLYTLMENYISVKAQQSVWVNLSNTFFKYVFMLILFYCIGTCAFGAPLLYAFPAVYGTGIGMVSAFLYANYALKGIGYCILILYPGEIVFCSAMMLACSVSIEMTNILTKCLSGQSDIEEHCLRRYTTKYGLLLFICAGSAVLAAALSVLFAGYFHFS